MVAYYPNADGINLGVVQNALATGAIYDNTQFLLNDAPPNAGNPAHCCAPQDLELSHYCGTCASRAAAPRRPLPAFVPALGYPTARPSAQGLRRTAPELSFTTEANST